MNKLTKLIAIFLASAFLGSCQYLMENPLSDGKYSTSPRKGQNLVDVVIGESDLTILESAVVQAGLADALSQPGPFTLFAPTDEAFKEAGIDLNAISNEELVNILKYHVVATGLLTKNLGERPFHTLNGQDFYVSEVDHNFFINGNTELVEFNIIATNGIIQKIDKVLMPPAGNIVEVAVSKNPEEFNALVAAVLKAELDGALANGGPFTVFAPTDKAFAEFFTSLGVSLGEVTKKDVAAVLQYHVVADRLFSPDLENKPYTTLTGEEIHVNTDNGVVINEDVNVIVPNVLATNGVIHVIDQVLQPKTETIVDIAISNPDFSILVQALQKAELVEALQGEGPFTVFAPTDQAFIDAGIDLNAVSKADLANILKYHVLAGRFLAKELNEKGFATLNGQKFFVDFNSGKIFINGKTEVIATDIVASNGVIHVLDMVLMPPAGNIVEIAKDTEKLSSLVAAVVKAQLASALSSDGPFTVFAPTNAAFAKLLAQLGVSLDEVNVDDLKDILLYHVVNKRLFSADLENTSYPTLNGAGIDVNTRDLTINGDVNIIATDIIATNGVVHLIDQVLMPPNESIVDIALNTARFSTLVAALKAADLVGVLQGDGPFTVFAPNNDAFNKLPAGVLDKLLKPKNKQILKNILLYHVDNKEILSTDLKKGINTVKPLNGSFFSVVKTPHQLFIRDINPVSKDAHIINVDIKGSNGVIHEIDEVLLPRGIKF
jgi:transforming growth factor-beta-induced protein